ncbi:MAG: hypothetical protein QW702_02000 [Candidatus Bathyarchaeia archaeon]
MNRVALALGLIILVFFQVLTSMLVQALDYAWKDNFSYQNLNESQSAEGSANRNVPIAIIYENPKSMHANLKILGIKYDAYDRSNLTNLNIENYSIILIDYNVGIRGQGIQPSFDITDWIQINKDELIKWIHEGGH